MGLTRDERRWLHRSERMFVTRGIQSVVQVYCCPLSVKLLPSQPCPEHGMVSGREAFAAHGLAGIADYFVGTFSGASRPEIA